MSRGEGSCYFGCSPGRPPRRILQKLCCAKEIFVVDWPEAPRKMRWWLLSPRPGSLAAWRSIAARNAAAISITNRSNPRWGRCSAENPPIASQEALPIEPTAVKAFLFLSHHSVPRTVVVVVVVVVNWHRRVSRNANVINMSKSFLISLSLYISNGMFLPLDDIFQREEN